MTGSMEPVAGSPDPLRQIREAQSGADPAQDAIDFHSNAEIYGFITPNIGPGIIAEANKMLADVPLTAMDSRTRSLLCAIGCVPGGAAELRRHYEKGLVEGQPTERLSCVLDAIASVAARFDMPRTEVEQFNRTQAWYSLEQIALSRGLELDFDRRTYALRLLIGILGKGEISSALADDALKTISCTYLVVDVDDPLQPILAEVLEGPSEFSHILQTTGFLALARALSRLGDLQSALDISKKAFEHRKMVATDLGEVLADNIFQRARWETDRACAEKIAREIGEIDTVHAVDAPAPSEMERIYAREVLRALAAGGLRNHRVSAPGSATSIFSTWIEGQALCAGTGIHGDGVLADRTTARAVVAALLHDGNLSEEAGLTALGRLLQIDPELSGNVFNSISSLGLRPHTEGKILRVAAVALADWAQRIADSPAAVEGQDGRQLAKSVVTRVISEDYPISQAAHMFSELQERFGHLLSMPRKTEAQQLVAEALAKRFVDEVRLRFHPDHNREHLAGAIDSLKMHRFRVDGNGQIHARPESDARYEGLLGKVRAALDKRNAKNLLKR